MKKKIAASRVLIGIVLFFNLQCAFVFLINPAGYIGGFGLEGMAGEQMVRALGLLFVMWNVPYGFALANPMRNRVSLLEAVLMQAVGLTGESAILLIGGPYPAYITATVIRFIVFDGIGLVLLVTALALMRPLHKYFQKK